MATTDRPLARALVRFSPLWLFLIFFKFGGGLHYSLLSPLGAHVLPLWLVGIVMGLASFLQFAFDVPAGKLLDRYGYRKLMLIGTAIFILGALCLTLPFSLPTYLASVFLSVFGWQFFGPGTNAYILSSTSSKHSGFFMSLRDISGSIGIVLSSALLAIVLLLPTEQMGWTLVVLLTIAFIAIGATPVEKTTAVLSEHHHRRSLLKEFSVLKKVVSKLNPASTMLLFLHTASGIFYGMIWFVVPLIISENVHSEILGIGLGVFDFSVVALGFVLGMLADRANKRRLVFFGLLVFAVFGTLIGFNFNIYFILFGFLATAGEEMAGLSLWSWLHVLDHDHANDGTVSGIISLFEDFGWMIGPIAGGLLFTAVGPSWAIAIGALPIFITWLLYFTALRDHDSPHALVAYPGRMRTRRHKK